MCARCLSTWLSVGLSVCLCVCLLPSFACCQNLCFAEVGHVARESAACINFHFDLDVLLSIRYSSVFMGRAGERQCCANLSSGSVRSGWKPGLLGLCLGKVNPGNTDHEPTASVSGEVICTLSRLRCFRLEKSTWSRLQLQTALYTLICM